MWVRGSGLCLRFFSSLLGKRTAKGRAGGGVIACTELPEVNEGAQFLTGERFFQERYLPAVIDVMPNGAVDQKP